MDYMRHNEHNFVAADKNVTLTIFGNKVEAESIWYSDKEDKIYLHVGCKEFEGDLDIDSLSDDNQQVLYKVFGDTEGSVSGAGNGTLERARTQTRIRYFTRKQLARQVTVTCYGKKETMTRKEALDKYYEGMMCCEGSERDRYVTVYCQLMEGLTDVDDGC